METNLKLNYKKTFLMGSAFFSILLLWQVYNTYCPVFLQLLLAERLQGDTTYIIGIIMAMDNLFALFMIPIFGSLSDKTKTKYGKRKPYIILGMLISALLFPLIAVFYFLNTSASLVLVIVFMGIILFVMNVYRNPAVALMPDITPKPLRAKANGLINFIGYLGAIIGGGIAMIIKTDDTSNKIIFPFIIASICIIGSMLIFIFKVNEVKWLNDAKHDLEIGEKMSQTLAEVKVNKPLSKGDIINFSLILVAIFFWFMAFNSIETFLSLYCKIVFNNSKLTGSLVIILTISSLITFIPGAYLAMKIGRKLSIIIGLLTTMTGILIIFLFQRENYHFAILAISFALAGIGWALININSFPMLIEMSNKNNIGRFTGFYYMSSMIAQTLTPVCVGIVMTLRENLKPLFPYALIMFTIAFIIFIFVRNPKNSAMKKTILEAFDQD